MPADVKAATGLAERLEFTNSCSPEVGRLLTVLVAQAGPGKILELGTGCAVASAWMLAGLRPNQHFITVDNNPALHAQVSNLFASSKAEFVLGDWRSVLSQAPFAFAFVDIAQAKDDGEAVTEALIPGGLIMLDDFTPLELRLAKGHKSDKRREFWLEHPELYSVELLTTRHAFRHPCHQILDLLVSALLSYLLRHCQS